MRIIHVIDVENAWKKERQGLIDGIYAINVWDMKERNLYILLMLW